MRIILLLITIVLSGQVFATADLFIYPNDGQSKEMQNQDRYECHIWAAQQSGFDPSRYSAPQPVVYRTGYPHQSDINPITGAAGGAAMGAVGGAIAGNAGKGAAIGAGVGAVLGAFHTLNRHTSEREHYRYKNHQLAVELNQLRNDYNRAISACLEGRGYTVK